MMAIRGRDVEKAERERWIFEEFAGRAGLMVVPGSVESRLPPEPDILCRIEDQGPVAFELVELIDQGLARSIARAAGEAVWTCDPTLEVAQAKMRVRKYVTPHPMELVAYSMGGSVLPRDAWEERFAQRLQDLVDGSAFRRLWVCEMAETKDLKGFLFVHPPL